MIVDVDRPFVGDLFGFGLEQDDNAVGAASVLDAETKLTTGCASVDQAATRFVFVGSVADLDPNRGINFFVFGVVADSEEVTAEDLRLA